VERINKAEVRKAVEYFKDIPEALFGHDKVLLSLAQAYLSGEVVERGALEAWHTAFGTTQLTHAVARLEVAEKSKQFTPATEDEIYKIMMSIGWDDDSTTAESHNKKVAKALVGKIPKPSPLTREELIEIMAQTYCNKNNSGKEVDVTLITDMVDAILRRMGEKV